MKTALLRKKPKQTRSKLMVDNILEASIRVLKEHTYHQFTTNHQRTLLHLHQCVHGPLQHLRRKPCFQFGAQAIINGGRIRHRGTGRRTERTERTDQQWRNNISVHPASVPTSDTSSPYLFPSAVTPTVCSATINSDGVTGAKLKSAGFNKASNADRMI